MSLLYTYSSVVHQCPAIMSLGATQIVPDKSKPNQSALDLDSEESQQGTELVSDPLLEQLSVGLCVCFLAEPSFVCSDTVRGKGLM